MNFHLLDFISFTLTDVIVLIFLGTLILSVVEALLLLPFKINKPARIFLYSILVNVASSAVGFTGRGWYQETISSTIIRWLLAFIITILIEGFLFALLNKNQNRKKVWQAIILVNLITYIILFAITGGS